MGRRGPAPEPTALRVLRGNPGKRAINHEEPRPELIGRDSPLAKCPKTLTGEAKTLWDRVAPGAMQTGLLTLVDLPNFEAYCVSYARWRQFEKLTGKNLELAISKGYRNGAVKERQLMLQFSARFGFDPSSRSNVKIPPAKPESKADAFRARKLETA